MQGVRERGLHEKVAILAGITPMKSAGMARYMKNKVPGMDVPDELVKRMAGVPKENQADEGIQIAIESIQRLKEVEGIRGFHIMAIEWEEKVPEIRRTRRPSSTALTVYTSPGFVDFMKTAFAIDPILIKGEFP